MKLLAVILNYKTPEMTLQSVQSAITALNYFGSDWQLVVVDNDSQDGSYQTIKEKLAELPTDIRHKVSVVESGHNGGFGAGNNFAIRSALQSEDIPEYVYILNSDAFPAPDAIKLLSDHLDNNPETGIAGSYIHGTDGDPHTTAFRFPTIFSEFEDAIGLGLISKLLKNYVVPLGIPDRSQNVDWLAGASMMMRSSMLQEIGLFDEQFFLYFEETDLCKRAKNHNWTTTYILESKVAHIGSASTGMKKWDRIPRYWLDSRKHYFQKNHGHLYCHIATLARILGGLAWELRKLIHHRNDKKPPHFLRDLAAHWIKH